jgi:hypothetical protein
MSQVGGGMGTDRARALNQALVEGMTTRNIAAAIGKRGSLLTQADKNVLLGLSDGELSVLQSINAKLAPLGLTTLY